MIVLLQRLLITTTVNLIVLSIVCRLYLTLAQRSGSWLDAFNSLWLGALTVWSLLIRLALRRGLLLPGTPRFILLATDEERPLFSRLGHGFHPVSDWSVSLLCFGAFERWGDAVVTGSLAQLFPRPTLFRHYQMSRDTRSPIGADNFALSPQFEQQQERIPPALLANSGLSYDELPWGAPLSVQAQLKRLVDLLVSIALLLLTAPFVGLAALLISV